MPHLHADGTVHDHPPYVDDEGRLRLAEWAYPVGDPSMAATPLAVPSGPGPVKMSGATTATAVPLVSGGRLGVDRIIVPAGGGFAPHTHPGDHLLIVVKGRGTITLDGRIIATRPGLVYFVPGLYPHAVSAIDEHHILAVGSPHRAPDDPDRMAVVEYEAIASAFGVLRCELCDVEAPVTKLADMGCRHAPVMA